MAWINLILFLHPSADGHLGRLRLWAITNSVATNSHVLVFVWIYVFISLGDVLRSELLGHVVALCLHTLGF